MKKVLKILFIIFAIYIIFNICFILFFASTTTKKSDEDPYTRVERLTGSKMPDDAKAEYNYYINSFRGDSATFIVFYFENEPTKFLNSDFSTFFKKYNPIDELYFKNDNLSDSNREAFYHIYETYSEIDEQYKFNFGKEFCYLFYNSFKFIYVYEENLFYFVMNY